MFPQMQLCIYACYAKYRFLNDIIMFFRYDCAVFIEWINIDVMGRERRLPLFHVLYCFVHATELKQTPLSCHWHLNYVEVCSLDFRIAQLRRIVFHRISAPCLRSIFLTV